MTKIELTPEVVKFLREHSSWIDTKGERWYCMPYWFKKLDEGKYEICLFEEIPDYVKETVTKLRQGNAPDTTVL